MMRGFLLSFVIAFFSIALHGDGIADENRARQRAPDRSELRLVLEPTRSVFELTGDVQLHVSLENKGPNCFPIVIDPTFSSVASGRRPELLLAFSITDSQENPVEVKPEHGFLPAAISASQLLFLNCDHTFGTYVSFGQGLWKAQLGKGRYRVRAKLTINVRSFLEGRERVLRELSEIYGVRLENILQSLPDEEIWSDLVEFEVAGE